MTTDFVSRRPVEPRKSSGYPTFSNTEEDVLEQLNTEDFEVRLRILNRLRNTAQSNPDWFRTFHRKADLFKSIANVLQDVNWEVQHQCIKFLTDTMSDLGSDLDWCMALELPVLVRRLASPKVTVRRITIQALLTYARLVNSVQILSKALLSHGLSPPVNQQQAMEILKEMPYLFVVDLAALNWSNLVEGLVNFLIQPINEASLTEAALNVLEKLSSFIGQRHFLASLRTLPQSTRSHYETKLLPEWKSKSSAAQNLFNLSSTATVQHDSSNALKHDVFSAEKLRHGIIPSSVMEQLNNESEWRVRLSGLEQLKSILERMTEVEHKKLQPHLFSFINLLNNVLDDLNFKVVVVALDCLRICVKKLQRNVEALLPQISAAIAKHLGNQKSIIRQLNMMTAMELMQHLQPKPVIAALSANLQNKNTRVREEVLNIITVALLRFSSRDFNLNAIGQLLLPALVDQKKRIRLAAFECSAALANAMGKQDAILKIVRDFEETSNHSGLSAAISARLGRQKLSKVRYDGLLEYAAPGEEGLTANNEKRAIAISGADINWIMSAGNAQASPRNSSPSLASSHSSSGFGPLYARDLSPMRPDSVSPPTSPSRRVISAGRNKSRLPWESPENDDRTYHSAPVFRKNKPEYFSVNEGTFQPWPDGISSDKAYYCCCCRCCGGKKPKRSQLTSNSNNTGKWTARRNDNTGITPVVVVRPVGVSNGRPPAGAAAFRGHRFSLSTRRKPQRQQFLSKLRRNNVSNYIIHQQQPEQINGHVSQHRQVVPASFNTINSSSASGILTDAGTSFKKSFSLPNAQATAAPKRYLSPIPNETSRQRSEPGKENSSDAKAEDKSPFDRATKFRGSAHRRRSSTDVQSPRKQQQQINGGAYWQTASPIKQHLSNGDVRQSSFDHVGMNGGINGHAPSSSAYEDEWDNRPIKPATSQQPSPYQNGFTMPNSPTKKGIFNWGSSDNSQNKQPINKPQPSSPRKSLIRRHVLHNRVGEASATATESAKKSSPDQTKTRNPEQLIAFALSKLSSEEWTDKVEGMNILQRQVQENPDSVNVQLHPIAVALIEEAKNLRSSVARQALECFTDFFTHLKRNMEPEIDKITLVLMAKTGDVSSAFIREDAQHALETMVDNVGHAKSVGALITAGANNKSTVIRNACSMLVHRVVQNVGSNKALNSNREVGEKIVQAAAQFCQDNQPQARYYGKATLSHLSVDTEFDRTAKRCLSAQAQKVVRDVLEQLKTKGLGDPPPATFTPSASLASKSSSNPSSRTGSIRRRLNDAVQNSVAGISGGFASSQWEERSTALQEFAVLVKREPLAATSNIKLVESYVARLNDINSKVATQALENFGEVLPSLAPAFGDSLKTVAGEMVKALMAQLPSKNDEIRALALKALDTTINYADNGALVQPFSMAARAANVKQKPDMLYMLGKICCTAHSTKPKLVQIHGIPVLTDTLKAPQGDTATKQATVDYARALEAAMGKKTLLENCHSLNPSQFSQLKEMLE